MVASVKVTMIPGGVDVLTDIQIKQWFVGVLIDAQRFARNEVHVDTGYLRGRIVWSVDPGEAFGEPFVGRLHGDTNYALWQETEPGDSIPGVGTRIRSGGKPFLRPGVLKALRPYT